MQIALYRASAVTVFAHCLNIRVGSEGWQFVTEELFFVDLMDDNLLLALVSTLELVPNVLQIKSLRFPCLSQLLKLSRRW